MPSTAVSSQFTKLYIAGTPGSNLSITGITRATNAVVTASNTFSGGEVVQFGVVTGMPEINGLLGIVQTTGLSGTSFTVSTNTSGFAAPGTTGAATPQTFTQIINVHDYSGFDGSASEIDVTNLDSTAMENRPGLQDFGQFSFNIDVDDTSAGHLALRAAKTTASYLPFRVVMPNGKVRAFIGWVKKFSESVGVNSVIKASVDIRITGSVVFA